MGMAVTAVWDQDSYRFRNDDGSETTATWMAAANTTPADIPVDTVFRLRFLLQETAGSNQAETPWFVLQYRVNTGGGFGSWTDVPSGVNNATPDATSPVRYAVPNNSTGNQETIYFGTTGVSVTTTQQIGAGTFRGGRMISFATSEVVAGSVPATAGNDEYEFEYALVFDSDNTTPASAGDIFEFRVLETTTALDTYTRTPSVTVADSGVTLTADGGTYAVTGTTANLEQSRTIDATTGGTYAVSGTDATLVYGKTLAANAGSYSISGTDAGFLYGYEVQANAGSYSISGADANLEQGYALTVDGGSYSVSGTDATLTVAVSYTIAADAGSYAILGTDANLEWGRTLATDASGYSISGTNANLEYGYAVTATAGSYSLTGGDASLLYGYNAIAEASSYSLAGTDANLEHGRMLTAEAGSYALSGTDANLEYGFTVTAEAGSYSVTGADANLEYGFRLAADGSSYTISGTDATLTLTPVGATVLAADAGTYTFVGTDAALQVARLLAVGGGSYALSGTDAALSVVGANTLVAEGGSYSVAGTDATLTYTPVAGETPARPSGGYLPIIYVDRDGNPVLDEQPVEVVEPPKPQKKQPRKPANVKVVAEALSTSVDAELIEITQTLRDLEADLQERMRKQERSRLEAEWREYQRQQIELIEQWRAEQQRQEDWLFLQNQNALAALLLID